MSAPTYKIISDDDPGDCRYPMLATLADLIDAGDDETVRAVGPLAVDEETTVGGGAAPQFTIVRIL